MLQAPEPGKNVEVVAAAVDFGAGFAGAVRVNPRVAAVAGNPAG